MFTSIAKYIILALAIALVGAIGYGLWQRGQSISARADAKAANQALTNAESQLGIARSLQKLNAAQNLKLNMNLDLNLKVRDEFTYRQLQLEKTNASVADYLRTPIPCPLGRLWDEENGLPPGKPCPVDAGGKPASAVP